MIWKSGQSCPETKKNGVDKIIQKKKRNTRKKWTKLSRNRASRKRNEIQGKSGQSCPEKKKMNCPKKEMKYKEKVDKVVQKRKKMVSRKETKHKE